MSQPKYTCPWCGSELDIDMRPVSETFFNDPTVWVGAACIKCQWQGEIGRRFEDGLMYWDEENSTFTL